MSQILAYIGVFFFLVGTVAILSRLKPIGPASGVDWSEYTKCESQAEKTLFQELARQNFRMRTQVKLPPFRIDIFLPDYNLCIEVDSIFHDTPEAQAKDARKDAAIRAAGWEVVRVRGENFKKNMAGELSKIYAMMDWQETAEKTADENIGVQAREPELSHRI